MADGLEDREFGDTYPSEAVAILTHPPFVGCLLVNKGGPCPHGPHSPAAHGQVAGSSFILSQETPTHFIADGEAKRLCPLELPPLFFPLLEANDLGQSDSLLQTPIPPSTKWAPEENLPPSLRLRKKRICGHAWNVKEVSCMD